MPWEWRRAWVSAGPSPMRSTSHAQRRASDVSGGLGALSRALRMLLQSLVLGLGAYLVIYQEATAGVIIASSILVSRTLAPVEIAVANWKPFVAARQSWTRLCKLLEIVPAEAAPIPLPAPRSPVARRKCLCGSARREPRGSQ